MWKNNRLNIIPLVALILVVILLLGCNDNAKKVSVEQVDVMLIHASENGQEAQTPFFAGELSVEYISGVLKSLEEINNDIKITYGYENLDLKGETRNILLIDSDENTIRAQLDTFFFDLELIQQNNRTMISISLRPIGRILKDPVIKTRITYLPHKTTILGLGQTAETKRSAYFLVISPTQIKINTESDLENLRSQIQQDMLYKIREYRIEKSIRNQLGFTPYIVEDFENLYKFFKVTKKPKMIKNVTPDYPKEALDAEIEGIVVTSIIIKEDGSIGEGTIFKSLHPSLDSSAINATKKLQFEPAEFEGEKVKTIMNIPFRFVTGKNEKFSNDILRVGTSVSGFTDKLKPIKSFKPETPKNYDKSKLPDMNIVSVIIDEVGKVINAKIIRASKSSILDNLSIEAAKKFEFTTRELDGNKVKGYMKLAFTYE